MDNPEALAPCLHCGGEIGIYREAIASPENTSFRWRCKICGLTCFTPHYGRDGLEKAKKDANTRYTPPRTYDGDLTMLMVILEDGWVAQQPKEECVELIWFLEEPFLQHETEDTFAHWHSNGREEEVIGVKISQYSDWRTSLRRIHGGKIVAA